jgi:anaerobic ribonucleoside-triphosphate reductase
MTARPLQRQKCEVYSRVVGYLSPVGRWNAGKKQEFGDRKTFSVGSRAS